MIELHKKILALREQVSELYHEVCEMGNLYGEDLADLELSVCGSLNELHMAVEIVEDLIDEECSDV
jgi:hypothetical protein